MKPVEHERGQHTGPWPAAWRWAPLGREHLEALYAIEVRAYPFPWTRLNFEDSWRSGYDLHGLCDAAGDLRAYWVVMRVVLADSTERHLLNLTVAPEAQRQGLGLSLLAVLCRENPSGPVWLEVRESNTPARALYARAGFAEVGRRKGYYPAPAGQREDAIVMTWPAPGLAYKREGGRALD